MRILDVYGRRYRGGYLIGYYADISANIIYIYISIFP